MSLASVDAVTDSGASRLIIVARTIANLVVVLPPGILLNLTSVKSVASNWVSGSPIIKCPGDK